MIVKIIKANIVELEVDAIVNAANVRLFGGTGVCGAIFDAAGYDEMTAACQKIGGCGHGAAVITPGFRLQAKYVIHTVGPIYGQHDGREEEILYSCYYESLRLADENKVKSIAFPEISTGIYGYPKDDARRVAEQGIADYFEDIPDSSLMTVYLTRF